MSYEPASRRLTILDEGVEVSYDGYVENMTDPGNTLLIIAVFISVCSIVCVPLVAKLGKYIMKVKKKGHNNSCSSGDDCEVHNITEEDSGLQPSHTDAPEPLTNLSFLQQCLAAIISAVRSILDSGLLQSRKRGAHYSETVGGRRAKISRGMANEA